LEAKIEPDLNSYSAAIGPREKRKAKLELSISTPSHNSANSACEKSGAKLELDLISYSAAIRACETGVMKPEVPFLHSGSAVIDWAATARSGEQQECKQM